MPHDQPTKVVSFDYRICKNIIQQVKVNLSNGFSSNMFAGSDTDELSELKTLHIKDIAQIKRVQGLTDEYYIHELIFKITDGTEEGRIEAY